MVFESLTRESVVITTTEYNYDGMGRLYQVTQGTDAGGVVVNYTYNKADQVISVSYMDCEGISNVLGYVYDNYGRISEITLKTGSGAAKTVRQYFYKANGELDYTKDYRGFEENAADYIKTAYIVNNLGLTTKITYEDHAAGSTTGTKKEEYTMAYDKRGYITSETAYTNYGTAETVNKTYTYDNVGRLTHAKITTPDYVNNAVVNNEVIQTNAYNASGQRIQKVEDGETTNYYYMGSALLLSANANNWLLTENILDPSGTIVASARFDDTNPGVAEGFYFYHYDMRGSTTAIVGANGNLQKGYTYDEFGSVEESGNTSFLNEVTFTGSVTDKSTGLQYMNARFYDSDTGRFISQDSYTGNPYDPWTQHLYVYTSNNPVNFRDPTGYSMETLKSELNQLNAENRLQKQMRDGFYSAMQYYKEHNNSQMYNVCYENYLKYNSNYLSTSRKVIRTQTTYNELSELQGYIDNEEFDLIDQSDYPGLLLFDNNDVDANGCGFIAAVIAAKNLGSDIDVHDAYLYFNKPNNELLNTGAIRPSVVTGFLMEQGYYPTGASYDMISNGTYITYYKWKNSLGSNWHYECLITDENGAITSFNNCDGPHQTFGDYVNKNDIVMLLGLAYYAPY